MGDDLRFAFDPRAAGFRILPRPGRAPEVVRVRALHGPFRAGPSDERIQVVDATNKASFKDDHTLRYRRPPPVVPFQGRVRTPVAPDPDGGFLSVEPGTREFLAAAAFGAARCTFEIWRHHFQRDLPWHFDREAGGRGAALHLFPRVRSANSWVGEGFMEFGFDRYPDEGYEKRPFALNFDAVAHEMGHLMMKSLHGNPPFDERSIQYRAHEEAAADLIAAIAVMHFDSVVEASLERTGGLLHGATALSLVSEWGRSRRLKADARNLYNDVTVGEVRRKEDPEPDKFSLSLAFSGAAFDALLGVFYVNLADRGVLPAKIAGGAFHRPGHEPAAGVRAAVTRAYARDAGAFKTALLDARDHLARSLARAWRSVSPVGLTFSRVLARLLDEEARLAAERGRPPHTALLRASFAARGIAAVA